uniref:6-phosphogluconolactonase n=1 Tax=Rhabditophanes sp. KR3021 TaxID=114890 RepID=A0AC35TNT8_9BILA
MATNPDFPHLEYFQQSMEMTTNDVGQNLYICIMDKLKNPDDHVYIGLSGGSQVKVISSLLRQFFTNGLLFNRIHIFMVDERILPLDHPDSNMGSYMRLTPPEMHFCFMPIAAYYDPNDVALEFSARFSQMPGLMFNEKGFPIFDLLIMGLGPDGHFASLFPNHPVLNEEQRWFAPVYDSPKPPPQRITLTIPVVNAAHKTMFFVIGADKVDILEDIFKKSVHYPPCLIVPENGDPVVFYIEYEAGKKIDLPVPVS